MNKNGSMTLIATLFLLMIVTIITFQIKIFQSEQQKNHLLIQDYQHKIHRIR